MAVEPHAHADGVGIVDAAAGARPRIAVDARFQRDRSVCRLEVYHLQRTESNTYFIPLPAPGSEVLPPATGEDLLRTLREATSYLPRRTGRKAMQHRLSFDPICTLFFLGSASFCGGKCHLEGMPVERGYYPPLEISAFYLGDKCLLSRR